MSDMPTIDIVFDGFPGPVGPRFVEVERDGKSIRFGGNRLSGGGIGNEP